MTIACLFPGQGSQSVGMTKDLIAHSAAVSVVAEADAALGFKLSELMINGPKDQLDLTEHTQPALLVAGVAAFRTLEAMAPQLMSQVKFVAGHSLGQWTALVAAGVLSLADAVKLVRLRGQSMQAAVPAGVGGMAAILGMSWDDVSSLAKECSSPSAQVVAANDNANGQVVISGHKTAVDAFIAQVAAKGIKAKCVPLPVSVPAHSPLMQPAADQMAQAIATIPFQSPRFAVVSNIDARPHADAAIIKQHLIDQLTRPVLWVSSVQYMHQQGVNSALELGSGKVLAGMMKRTIESLPVTPLDSVSAIEQYLNPTVAAAAV